ncbi:MAG: hypothetical protein ABIB97_04490 [Patescibacteria group bacterium]
MNNKIPISPAEVIKRTKNIPKILEWSKKKRLTISGPEFWGTHYIYINNSLKHVIFCLKADLTTHVFIGDPIRARVWEKYDKNLKKLLSKKLDKDSLKWKVYKDCVLYRGNILPPKDIPAEPYYGKVVKVDEFDNDMNENWVVSEIAELFKAKR